jgi:transcriptional regulator with XRE-family HTH domain
MPCRHIYGKPEYSEGRIGTPRRRCDYSGMSRRSHFLVQWRRHRGLNQVQLAERLGITQGQLSKIENFKKPWDEDLLYLAAVELRCAPVDILTRDPSAPESIWSLWDQVPETRRDAAIDMLKGLAKTGTDG